MAVFLKSRHLLKTLNPSSSRSISTFTYLSQEPELAEPPNPSASTVPLPPNPSFGTPIFQENWRNPNAYPSPPSDSAHSLVPLGFIHQTSFSRLQTLAQTLDTNSLMNIFADWATSQRWLDIKQLFEFWIRTLDTNGLPKMPHVDSYNFYIRANLQCGVLPADLVLLIEDMKNYQLTPNTASYNLLLKCILSCREVESAEMAVIKSAEMVINRMLETGKEALPDDESYDLIMGIMFKANLLDDALKYLDMTLKSGCTLHMKTFNDCAWRCLQAGRLDTLAQIIQRCKTMEQNKALCPDWKLCVDIAHWALQEDNGKLAFFALEFFARWMARGVKTRPPVQLSIDEGLVISALGTAGRTYNPTLIEGSWSILHRSLRQKSPPSPESYLSKIYALASLDNLPKAFGALIEFESVYGSSTEAETLFSPFTSLHPLVVACCKKGYDNLDKVYVQLETLSQADPPHKSVAALNCILLGCANIWDLNRAYETFVAFSKNFGLTPDIHSYNALMYAYGKLKKIDEASSVFDHLTSMGVKPNATTYALLVDAHVTNLDAKAALSVIDEEVKVGFKPSKDMLQKVRRRSIREFDYESFDRVEELARTFKIRMGSDNRKGMLFNLEYSMNYP
ncbi:hypothetical protein IFM89_008106 [Coptis chinensis]|uniref:Pentatricopeptide repeat-containing protein n=1 Tax=Coptis chinensis TaxID=261450 RepID=A0A835IVU3_9MAGN|nr:hypothetical protein IFM89_008106 [Coptis chinensis]